MEISDLISIGIIKQTFGNNGFVTIIPETDLPEHFKKLSKIFLVFPDDTVQSKIIESCKITENKISLKFINVNSRNDAQNLKNARIMIPENDLFTPKENEFYHSQLEEYLVFLPNGKMLGKIDYIFSNKMYDILAVKDGNKEILIPFLNQFIEKIIKSEKKIIINPIEGLLDAN